MSDIPDNVIDKELYQKVKDMSNKIYKRKGAYRSMYITKKYQELGGRYTGTRKGLTTEWLKSQWIQVIPYITKGEVIVCGASNRKGKVCRPLKRISKKTPITIDEVIKKHGKRKVLSLARQKINDMDGRVLWVNGLFVPSLKK